MRTIEGRLAHRDGELRAARTVLRQAAGCPHLRRNPGLVTALTAHAEVELERYLSINTVKGYTEILYRKLGVSTLQEAVRQARALGLL